MSYPILRIENLSKCFGPTTILRSIDISVNERELVFLIGPSGSGKSTLLRCCNRLEEPDHGSIYFEGVDVLRPGTDLIALRRRIGMVFQSFNLYPHMTALGNVTLAMRMVVKKSKADAEAAGLAALERVGLLDKARNYPNQLSGGQQQRVAIARALVMEPKVMLFDEPTSALDPELVGSVLSVMREMSQAGMTMVVVSHEIRFAREAADKVIFMQDGIIVESGSAAEMFKSPQNTRTREFLSTHRH